MEELLRDIKELKKILLNNQTNLLEEKKNYLAKKIGNCDNERIASIYNAIHNYCVLVLYSSNFDYATATFRGFITGIEACWGEQIIEIKYHCHYCKREYDTEKEWLECERECENAMVEMLKTINLSRSD